MNREFYVYKHVSLDDNKTFYIGKGKGYRAYDKSNRNKYWIKFTNKHKYKVIILKNNLSEKEAYDLEFKLIILYKKYGRAKTNINTDYGSGGRNGRTNEDYALMGKNLSKNMKGKYIGNKNPMFGKVHSEKTRKIISEKNKGLILGVKKSEETRKKMSENHRDCKKVINTETNKIFYSIKDAAMKNNITIGKMTRYLYGKTKNPTNLKFYI